MDKSTKLYQLWLGTFQGNYHEPSVFFLEKGGIMVGKVYEERCRPSPIPKGGLELVIKVSINIKHEKIRYLKRLKKIITSNYQDPEGEESFNVSSFIQTEEKVHDVKREQSILKMTKINKKKLYA